MEWTKNYQNTTIYKNYGMWVSLPLVFNPFNPLSLSLSLSLYIYIYIKKLFKIILHFSGIWNKNELNEIKRDDYLHLCNASNKKQKILQMENLENSVIHHRRTYLPKSTFLSPLQR
jgi:hypothetical protein